MPSYHHKLIMVCANCLTASCWHYELICDEAKTADTTLKTISELKKLRMEHPDNWKAEKLKRIYGHHAPFGYQSSPTKEVS